MVFKTLGQFLSLYYKWNMDATSLLVQSSGTGMMVTVVRALNTPPKQVTTTRGGDADGELDLSVKAPGLNGDDTGSSRVHQASAAA